MKQGLLSELDKVETKAKARAARDYGIGTKYALDFDTGKEDETEVTSTLARSTVVSEAPVKVIEAPKQAAKPKEHTLNELFRLGKAKGFWSDLAGMADIATPIVGIEVVTRDDLLKLSELDIAALREYIVNESARELATF